MGCPVRTAAADNLIVKRSHLAEGNPLAVVILAHVQPGVRAVKVLHHLSVDYQGRSEAEGVHDAFLADHHRLEIAVLGPADDMEIAVLVDHENVHQAAVPPSGCIQVVPEQHSLSHHIAEIKLFRSVDKIPVQPDQCVQRVAQLHAVPLRLAFEIAFCSGRAHLGGILDNDVRRPVIAAVLIASVPHRDLDRAVLVSVFGKVCFNCPLIQNRKINRQEIVFIGKISVRQVFRAYRSRLRTQQAQCDQHHKQHLESFLHARLHHSFSLLPAFPVCR